MSNVLRLAIVDPNDSSRESLKTMLLGMDMIWLEAECSRYEFFADVVGQTGPDIGIVSLDDDPQKGLDLVTKLAVSSPDCSILVVSSSSDGNLILQAMRAGAKEYITHPVRIEDLAGALGRIGERRRWRRGHVFNLRVLLQEIDHLLVQHRFGHAVMQQGKDGATCGIRQRLAILCLEQKGSATHTPQP